MNSLINFIIAFGYLALFTAVLLESGVIIGFFLPGDSLLFTAGLLAAKGHFNLFLVMLVCFVGAILGVQLGYWFGVRVGPALFKQKNFFLRTEHLEKTQQFYDKFGAQTIILARFTPIVRTFAPILAGVAKMDYKTFVRYNLIGAVLWAIGIPLLGYLLGNLIPNIDHYLLPIIILIVIASALPAIKHLFGDQIKNKVRGKR